MRMLVSFSSIVDRSVTNRNIDLKVKLANSTESEIKTLQSSLRASKDDVASDLQRNVFKKYSTICSKYCTI